MSTLLNHFKKRREQKLRKELLFAAGFNSTTHAIDAWVNYILYGKTTKELLLSTSERQRMEELRRLSGVQIEQP